MPSAPIVSQITQLTADPVANNAAVSFVITPTGLLTPGSVVTYQLQRCGGVASTLPVQLIASVTVPAATVSPSGSALLTPVAVGQTVCVVAWTVNEAGRSANATSVPLPLMTAATFIGVSSTSITLSGLYSTSTLLGLNQGPALASSATIHGSVVIAALNVSVAAALPPFTYSFNQSSADLLGDDFAHAASMQYLLSDNGNAIANSSVSWLPSSYPQSTMQAPGQSFSNQLALFLSLANADGSPYRSLSAVQVSYQPLPDLHYDPDIIAETLYATTTLTAVASQTLTAAATSTASVAFAPSLAGDGSYQVIVYGIPTQPGGVLYAVSVTDVSAGLVSASSQLAAPFITQTVFVPGPPSTPVLQSVQQSGRDVLLVSYQSSLLDGTSYESASVVQYSFGLTDLLTGRYYSLPVSAVMSTAPSGMSNTLTTLSVLQSGVCTPPSLTVTVALRGLPNITLPAPGHSQLWELTVTAVSSLAASVPSSLPIAVHAAPPAVSIPIVTPIALNQYRLTFALPPAFDSATGLAFPTVLSWLVGYTYGAASALVIDPVASASVTVISASQPSASDALYGSSSTRWATTVLTLPFPSSAVNFSISVQAVNSVGPSALRLHAFTPSFVSLPSIVSVTQLQGEDGDQSLSVTWTGSALYVPSASLASGFRLTHSPVGNSQFALVASPTQSSLIVSGLPLSSPVVVLSLYSMMNSTDNRAKACSPGAVTTLLSAPSQLNVTLVQPAQPPSVSSITQTSLSTISISFTPSDGQQPAVGQAAIKTYRAEYLLNTLLSTYNSSAAAVLSFNNASVVPTQTLSSPPYSSAASMLTNQVQLTGLPVTAPGSSVPLLVGVTGRNIAGWGYAALVQLPNGLLGVPVPPTLTFSQQSAGFISSIGYVASVTLSFALVGVITPQYSLTYTATPINAVPGASPVTGTVSASTGAVLSNGSWSITVTLPSLQVALGGSAYSVSVVTTNEVGASASAAFPITVASVPLSPSALVVSTNSSQQQQTVTVSWQTPSAGGGSGVMSQFALSWWASNGSSSQLSPLGSVLLNASVPQGSANSYSIFAPSLAGYMPGAATNYTFAVYSISQLGSSRAAPGATYANATVSTPDVCCLRFAGGAAYPSFTLPSSGSGGASILTIAGLQTYAGAPLPWYGGFLGSPVCQDWWQAYNQPRLQYFDAPSGQWLSSFTLNGTTYPATAAFQLVSSWNNEVRFVSWDVPAPAGPSFLAGKTLRMPLQCSLSAFANVNTCVEFTINAPSAQLAKLSYTPAQRAQCDALLAGS